MNRFFRATAFAAALTFAAAGAHAATVKFKADLKASSEVPPKNSAGTGTLTATLNTDTHVLRYRVVFRGMTGPVIAAHFHGPAPVGVNAGPQIPVTANPIISPIRGKATLTPEQEKDLEDGNWYFNLHTKANPGGEIRGQIYKVE